MVGDALPENLPKSCGEFNYCFWAKLIVAIPAIPLAVVIAASLFSNPLLQILAGGAAGFLLIYLAIKVDKMPALSGMVCKKKN